jgi:hypothetical protein
MTATEILTRIRQNTGAFMRVLVLSNVPTLKSVQGVTVTKLSSLFVTAGTEFASRKDVRDAIEAGTRGEVGPLPWGAWVEYPFIIGHVGKDGVYAEYVRLYPPSEKQLEHFNLGGKVEFFADDQPITRDEAIRLCGSKAEAKEVKSEAFAVKAGNIISIG